MPWTAISKTDGNYVNLANSGLQNKYYSSQDFVLDFGNDFYCPCTDCQLPVHPVKRVETRLFFRHNPGSECKSAFRTSDNYTHNEAVYALSEYFNNLIESNKKSVELIANGKAEIFTEFPFPEINRRADLVLMVDGKPTVVHEIQLSPISSTEINARIKDYKKLGIDCLWHFGMAASEDRHLTDWFFRTYGYLSTPFEVASETSEEVLLLAGDLA